MGARQSLVVGSVYGRLTVMGVGSVIPRRSQSLCRCTCGATVEVQNKRLLNGHTKSCGCFKEDVLADRNYKHGLSYSPEYGQWQDIKKRCFNKGHKFWSYYGGRGITMSPDWAESFEAFYADMGPRPFDRAEIDRIDNSLGYGKENCRWATRVENMRNTRFNKMVEYKGRTACLAEWSDITGLGKRALSARLLMGWSVERALTEPLKVRRNA